MIRWLEEMKTQASSREWKHRPASAAFGRICEHLGDSLESLNRRGASNLISLGDPLKGLNRSGARNLASRRFTERS
jgi:hypothetical protein